MLGLTEIATTDSAAATRDDRAISREAVMRGGPSKAGSATGRERPRATVVGHCQLSASVSCQLGYVVHESGGAGKASFSYVDSWTQPTDEVQQLECIGSS